MRTRVSGWRTKLGRHIEENRFRPHEYGAHDCALWAASSLPVVYGVANPGLDHIGKYDAGSALAYLGKLSRLGLHGLAVKWAGPAKHPAFALAGDIVSVDLSALGASAPGEARGLSLGVCYGATSFFAGVDGLVPLPTILMEHAYG